MIYGQVVFYGTALNVGKKLWNKISSSTNIEPTSFSFTEYDLARFALSIIDIANLPSLKYGSGSNNGSESITMPYGHKSLMPSNSEGMGASSYTVDIKFLEMANPIIESFIIPWMIFLQKNNYEDSTTDIKLNIVIKFYRSDEIAGLDSIMNPTFIYRLTGLYPTNISLVKPSHGAISAESNSRTVTFNFDNLMVFSNAQYEQFITGNRTYFAYENMSPVQILNKLNYQAGNVASIYNQIKNTF